MSGLKARLRQKDYHRLQLMVVPSPKKGQDDVLVYGRTARDRIAKLVAMVEQKQISPADLKQLKLDARNVDLRGIKLRVLGAQVLRQANFTGADLSGQDFSRMNLLGFTMPGAKALGINFDYSMLNHASMDGALLDRASFHQASAIGAKMNGVQAREVNWQGVFRGFQAYQADMRYGLFSDMSDFDRSEMSAVKLDGAKTGFGTPFMTNANLTGSSLKGNFAEWNFSGSKLVKVDATGSKLDAANFIGADVTGMKTAGASMARVNLTDAKDHQLDKEIKLPEPTFGWAPQRDFRHYQTLKAMALIPEPEPKPSADNDNDGAVRPGMVKKHLASPSLDYAA